MVTVSCAVALEEETARRSATVAAREKTLREEGSIIEILIFLNSKMNVNFFQLRFFLLLSFLQRIPLLLPLYFIGG
jgi:hypothetical protein